ncbi:MAG TPA: AMP-binding protein [Steroidobacteraceae bacterium]|nr:AMP-binding protein [Steroidobacteraceae bacterium]
MTVEARPERRPPWFDPRVPSREDCVLRPMLDARAARHPERRFALFEDGTSWTYGECLAEVRATAAGLQRLGVRKGDRVLAWLPTGKTILQTWFAANYLGAVFVPLNTAYRGAVLAHVVNAARARVLVAHPALAARLEGLELAHLTDVVVADEGNAGPAVPGVRMHGASVLRGDGTSLDDGLEVDHWDEQSIIYTSGTTGLSKGVLSPYLQLYTTASIVYGYLREGESILVNLPMFHVGGTSAVYIALIRGGGVHLVDGFSTTRFWDQVREGHCATTSGLIGVMAAFLAREPARPDDRDNPLRCMTMFPVNEETVAFARRFGFDYLTGFNMTEVSAPLVTDINTSSYGSCGRPRSGVEARIVDEHDLDVPPGTIGELVLRSDTPWTMCIGYDGQPQATAEAWRNGWFHTGDLFRQDERGEFYFVDRRKDAIRRRGENISSFEVENAVRQFPDVEEAVAVGVQSEVAEEEVMVVVTSRAGRSVDPQALTEFLVPRLPYFMVPRYVRVVAEIPKTETNKVRKVVFREQGITADTWDRERAGLRLRREKL